MKHLKPFDKPFTKIELAEFNLSTSKFLNISNTCSILKLKYPDSKIIKYNSLLEIECLIKTDKDRSSNRNRRQILRNVKIFECKDEWFYVILDSRFLNINGVVYDQHVEHYKCDQMDGLVELLDNKGF